MALSAYDRVSAATESMSEAIHAALDALDAYTAIVDEVAREQRDSAEPNTKLIKRMEQFSARAEAMTRIIEDDVLTELNHCTDRLFSVKTAEQGEFI